MITAVELASQLHGHFIKIRNFLCGCQNLLFFKLLFFFTFIAQSSICFYPKVSGPCYARILRWYYNSSQGRCLPFIYGGCQGNGNNFFSREACLRACSRCYLPPITGPCLAYFPSWYYNPSVGKCLRFIYGGCLGNSNRFASQSICSSSCP